MKKFMKALVLAAVAAVGLTTFTSVKALVSKRR